MKGKSRFLFKGEGHLFHAVVLASAPPSTNFKSIYSNQFKRYEYIQGIWEMQNFMKNTMVKKFLSRAHFRARARRIFCLLGQILMIFEFSKRNEIWREPRAQVRAHKKIFMSVYFVKNLVAFFWWWYIIWWLQGCQQEQLMFYKSIANQSITYWHIHNAPSNNL